MTIFLGQPGCCRHISRKRVKVYEKVVEIPDLKKIHLGTWYQMSWFFMPVCIEKKYFLARTMVVGSPRKVERKT